MPFISVPGTNSSRIASSVGDAISASCRWRSMSSSESTRKTPRWPPESAGFSTAGNPTSSAARRRSDVVRTAANRGCGTPASARRRRIATLCVIRCAVSPPIPGSPGASATGATSGTARSALTVRTPSSFRRAVALRTASTFEKSTTFAMSASCRPGASGLRSTAATRRPICFAWRLARRWWRPAPTKRTVLTGKRILLRRERGAEKLERAVDVHGRAEARSHLDGNPVEHDAEEAADRVERHVAADATAFDELAEARLELALQLRVQGLPPLAQLGVRAQHAADVQVDGHPVGLLLGHVADDAFVAVCDPPAEEALLVGLRKRDEQVELRRVVAEDRAAGKADLALERLDGCAVVPELPEGTPRAVHDLAPALDAVGL